MARNNSYDELDDKPSSTKKYRPRRASFFGFLSTLTGLAALAVVYRDQISQWLDHRFIPFVKYDLGQLSQYLYQVKDYPVHAYHVAAAGAGLAVWALLWRKMLKRTKAGWPVLGLLVCASAAGIHWYQSTDRSPGTPGNWVQVNIVERAQKMFEKKQEAPAPPVQVSAPPEVTPDPVTVAPVAPITTEKTNVKPAPKPVTPEPKKENGSQLFPEL